MAFYTHYPSQQQQPQQQIFVYCNHQELDILPFHQASQPDLYGAVSANFNARDASRAPNIDLQSTYFQPLEKNAQPVPQHIESSMMHTLGDLHVSYSQEIQEAPDPSIVYQYGEAWRSREAEYEDRGPAMTTLPADDEVMCMGTAQVPCAEYGESYCSDNGFPYGALASPILPYDAASPYTDMADSPVTDFADPYADTMHSPVHFNSQGFNIPVIPSRSYTLEKAVTPIPSTLLSPPWSPSLAETKRSVSTSASLSETPRSSPGMSASSMPSLKASNPMGMASSSTSSSSGPGKRRGRPRKRQTLAPTRNSSPPRIVDYPFPKFDTTSSSYPRLPTPDTKCILAPKPGPHIIQPQVLSMDEIFIPDAESKPGQAIFKLNTPPEVKEKPRKKPVLACLFCRERKIACGQPLPGSTKCNQCSRRGLECEFPKESRRGQHKRGPRAARVAELTEAALSVAKRPLEPVPVSFSSSFGGEDGALASGQGSQKCVSVELSGASL